MAMHRTQLFLDEEQHRELARLAEVRRTTVSEIVRDYVDKGLEQDRQDREQRLAWLERANEIRQRIERETGVYPGDLVREARAERERDIELWLGHLPDADRR